MRRNPFLTDLARAFFITDANAMGQNSPLLLGPIGTTQPLRAMVPAQATLLGILRTSVATARLDLRAVSHAYALDLADVVASLDDAGLFSGAVFDAFPFWELLVQPMTEQLDPSASWA